MAKRKRKKWYEKHHDACMELRAKFGVKEGDGLRWIAAMKRGTEHERVMAEFMEGCARRGFWSVDYFDAVMGCYHANPVFQLLGRTRNKLTVIPGGKSE